MACAAKSWTAAVAPNCPGLLPSEPKKTVNDAKWQANGEVLR
jgi:hypothetical protein